MSLAGCALLAALAVLVAVADHVQARPPAVPEAASAKGAGAPEPARSWYGWQILIADTVALAAGGIGIAVSEADDRSEALAWGFVAYSLASPAIHLAHDRARMGLASLVMHVLSPLVAAGVVALESHGRAHRSPVFPVTMISLGFALPTVVDAAWFAWEPSQEPMQEPMQEPSQEPSQEPRQEPPRLSIAIVGDPGAGHMGLSLYGWL
ncbi:MAG: hypothetical protein OXR73_21030 [Myxococcales bacterium]|nr:hypothetical protein [Myxococcales bacterium]